MNTQGGQNLTLTLSFPGEGTAIAHPSADKIVSANLARPLANKTEYNSPSPGKERAGVRSQFQQMAKLVIAIFTMLGFCGAYQALAVETDAVSAPEWTKLLKHATKVEIVLLKDDHTGVNERSQHKLVKSEELTALKQSFQDDSHWKRRPTKCEPSYGARLIFELDNKAEAARKVSVDVCFSCHQIKVQDGAKVLFSDSDMKFLATSDLLKIFRTEFPNDPDLATVK